ncbi:hypothetical protein WJX74_002367 [Apatococcus lobatus]|uniref:Methyltransferase small domain-containing protein n=1 Tax=Apatococcus lobatus TaxID=904363 RepID=A0AAW1Q2F0_9CHLO
MKLKELNSLLQGVQTFENPKIDLEQYSTGPHLAAQLVFTADTSFGDICGKTVVDLGCGTGMLSIGAAMLGSSHVVGVDVDADALRTACSNVEEFQGLSIDFLQLRLHAADQLPCRLRADTVILNPPFGTRRKGADIEFLQIAIQVAYGAVYSLHKTSTRAHVQRVAQREPRVASAEVLAEMRFDLPATYAFHKQRSADIAVDLWRVALS